jgi:hypothetical protein
MTTKAPLPASENDARLAHGDAIIKSTDFKLV